jgi:ribonuclease T2
MRYLVVLIAALVLAPPGTSGAGGRAGEFDYYVLALSWNAAWCEAEGTGRGAAQCNPDLDIGFTLHGLWPQHIIGWPEFCKTPKRDPSRSETAAMADIMGSGGLAWYQWKKHGRCTGLDPADYFIHAQKAWQAIERPELLRRVRLPARIAPSAIEQAFLEVNAGLAPEGVTVTCNDRKFREVRICLSKDMTPRPCTGATARDCEISDPLFTPMR